MNPEIAVARLIALRAESDTLPPDPRKAVSVSWRTRTQSTFGRALGERHHITDAFVALRWSPMSYGTGDLIVSAFRRAMQQAQGLIDAAISELSTLEQDVALADEAGIDPELWAHVAPEVQAEAWGKVASQTAIFTEDRIRKWAGRPDSEIGETLGDW